LNLDSNSISYGEYIAPHNWTDALLEDNDNGVPTETGKNGIEEGLLFEYAYTQDLANVSSGGSNIDIPDFLIQAIVDYIKAHLIEDAAQFQVREYYMQRFRDRVSNYSGTRIAGARITRPNPYGVI
jgi:hypothetical protein